MIERLRAVSFIVITFTVGAASAQEARSSDQRARAQQLFESALADAQAGKYDEACPKFQASQDADPKTSTLINLGNCYDKNGQPASAWGAFREAENLARRAGRADLEAIAKSRARELEPKLLRLTIKVGDARTISGLIVMRDRVKVSAGEWNVAVPIDPGAHDISAEAPGHVAWKTRIEIKGPSETIDIPMLARAPAPIAAGPTPDRGPPRSWWTGTRTAGVVVMGVGVAGMAASGVLGLIANGNYQDARGKCADVRTCPGGAVEDSNRAYDLAAIATATFIGGAVVTAAGGALVLFAPAPESSTVARLEVGPGGIGLKKRW